MENTLQIVESLSWFTPISWWIETWIPSLGLKDDAKFNED